MIYSLLLVYLVRYSFTIQLIVRQTATKVVQETVTPRTQRIVGKWLLGCAGMCFGAVCIGGITRSVGCHYSKHKITVCQYGLCLESALLEKTANNRHHNIVQY